MCNTHTQPGREEPAGGWESAGGVPVTRRLNYSCIRSELWETAPPKHTHGRRREGGRGGRAAAAGPGAAPAGEPLPPAAPGGAGEPRNAWKRGEAGMGKAGWQPRSWSDQAPEGILLALSDTFEDLQVYSVSLPLWGRILSPASPSDTSRP